MKRTALYTAMASILSVTSGGAQGAMPDPALLDFSGTFSMLTGTPPAPVLTNISSGKDGGILIGVGQAQPPQANHPSHGGAPHPTKGKLDKEWSFFSNAGQHYTSSDLIVTNESVGGDISIKELDFSGWRVTWNGIPEINMGGGLQDCGTTSDGICVGSGGEDIGGTYDNGTQLATITCTDPNAGGAAADCLFGNDFAITYTAIVPQADSSGFGGVTYGVNVTGKILDPNGAPIANDDTARTIVENPVTIDVAANDNPAPDDDKINVTSAPANGSTDTTNLDGTVIYTPDAGFTGPTDSFAYTGTNINGTSNAATVTVSVTTNAAPVAVNDPDAATSTAVLDNVDLVIDILANDTDTNNDPGKPGGIDPNLIDNNSVVVTNSDGNAGTCVANADGTITYSQPSAAIGTVDTCTYTVNDIDAVNGALTSNQATVTITVTETTSDWPAALPPNTIPILTFEPGIGQPDQGIKPQKSWFSMQVSSTQLIYTPLEPGPDGGFIIGYNQPATGSHTGAPNGTEQTSFTAPWRFFSNTGFDLTRNGGITGKPDGTLDFFTKYVVSWNGIPVINLGGSSQFPQDLGFATITCSDKPCQDGSTYILEYSAHVEDVAGLPASGFNGVPYQLYLEGTVRFLDGDLATSDGTVTSQTRLTAGDPGIPDDPKVDLQCVGSCFDYTVDGITASRVSVVLPLTGGVPNSPVWRVLDNGVWRNFDTSVGDSVKSAPFIAGASGMVCPAPDDASYIDLENDTVANLGHQCIQLSITDNGLNDMDPAVGTVSDPSGLGTAGVPTFVDTRSSDTSGCSITTASVNPAQRGDWWLVAGLIGLLGWARKRIQN